MTQQHIPVTTAPLPFTPESAPMEATFQIKPLTEAEFDRLGFELFRHNIVPPSPETFRSETIEQAFIIYGDAEGEERANLLDSYWASEDAYRVQMDEWHQQERQRLADEADGAPKRNPYPMPERVMGLRDRNKALRTAEDLRNKSQILRDMTVAMQSYEPLQRAGIARLVILGWDGVKTPFVRENDIVPPETYEALRNEIGKDALRELENFCLSLGALSAEEVGNFESLPETGPPPAPLPELNSEKAPSAGNSTSEENLTPSNSNSSPIPEGESEEITGASSTSISPSTGVSETSAATLAEA